MLGVRGTTYVLSLNADGNYLAVLHGQAAVEGLDKAQEIATKDILETYPKLNPVVSFDPAPGAATPMA